MGYAERWLQGLSNAAVKLNVPVQFCMSYPRYILETLRLPAVTNARASDDFNVDGPAYEYPVRKNISVFLHLSLCLSRACLGKSSLFLKRISLIECRFCVWNFAGAEAGAAYVQGD